MEPEDTSLLSHLRMKRGGRGIMIWVKRAGVEDWWHRRETWAGDPLAQVWEW